MKRKDYLSEIRGLDLPALKGRLGELEKEIIRVSCKAAVEPLKEGHLPRSLRRARARVLTEIRARGGSSK